MTERRYVDILDLLKRKWLQEGKIPRDSRSEAVRYMVDHFHEMSKQVVAPAPSMLPLDAQDRESFSLLAQTLRVAGVVNNGAAELEVAKVALRYLYKMFEDDVWLNTFLQSKGRFNMSEAEFLKRIARVKAVA